MPPCIPAMGGVQGGVAHSMRARPQRCVGAARNGAWAINWGSVLGAHVGAHCKECLLVAALTTQATRLYLSAAIKQPRESDQHTGGT